jgi:hypothetical protein
MTVNHKKYSMLNKKGGGATPPFFMTIKNKESLFSLYFTVVYPLTIIGKAGGIKNDGLDNDY